MKKVRIPIITIILLLGMVVSAETQVDEGKSDVLYQKARDLVYKRKYAEAIDTLKSAFSYDPGNRRALMLMGDVYLKMGNLPGAEQAFNQLIQVDPHQPQGYVKMAELYWHWERYNEAMEFLRTASRLSKPPDADVYFWKGHIFRSIEQFGKADSIISEGLEYYPDNPRLLADYAATQIVLGDSLEAGKYIDSAYQLDSNSVYVVNTMVSYQIFRNNLDSASNYLERATALDPDDPFTRSNFLAYSNLYRDERITHYFIEGNKAFEKSLFRKARENYRKALKEDSLFFEVIVNLAYTNIHLGDLDRAVELFEKAAGMNQNYASVYIGWADALLGLNRFDEALEKYERAIELEPENEEYKQIYNDVVQALEELEQQNE